MKISSGNKDLDIWLNGGYEKDIITTIYGPAGCGKTNLCILAAVNQAMQGNKIIYIDTEGSFSADRLRQIAAKDSKDILKNIMLLRATTFWEQRDIFNNLLNQIKKGISLIVVDSISMLYRLELGFTKENKDKAYSINRSLGRQLRLLTEIATKRNIPVLITNQVYSDFKKNEDEKTNNVKMVGGDLLKYWSKCLIEIKKEEGKRIAILRKHRSMPEKEFSFTITDKGINKSGFGFFRV
jgi:DNA repair protein RadB